MSINTSEYLSNLYHTCKTDGLIREDGGNLSIFERIKDFFNNNSRRDYFLNTCKKLSEIDVSELSTRKRLDILIQCRKIKDKMRNIEYKNTCNTYLEQFEKSCFSKIDTREFTKTCIEKLTTKPNFWESIIGIDKRERTKERMLTFIQYFSDHVIEFGAISKIWSKFLNNTPSTSLLDKVTNKIIDAEEAILNTNNTDLLIKKHLAAYPKILGRHLGNFTNNILSLCIFGYGINSRIESLVKILAKHKDNKKFVLRCMHSINTFLNPLFHSENQTMSELSKHNLSIFTQLFTAVNDHIPTITENTDPDVKKLILDLKIKFANLPLPTGTKRQEFNHLYLTKKEQLNALIDHLQKEEDQKVDSLIKSLEQTSPSLEDLPRLVKLVSSEEAMPVRLSDENRQKLKIALTSNLKDNAPADWDHSHLLLKALQETYHPNYGKTDLAKNLRRVAKTKTFFANQKDFTRKDIRIPLWYHATGPGNINPIITSKQIKATWGGYYGAWFSTMWQFDYGQHVFVFGSEIFKKRTAAIHCVFDERRWRGIQENVPLVEQDNRNNLVLSGYVKHRYLFNPKPQRNKDNKIHTIQLLKSSGIKNPVVFSHMQMHHLSTTVAKVLGVPNLSEEVWST